MNAWPMLERCLQNQWLGYTPQEREMIQAAWASGALPGLVGSLAFQREYILWGVLWEVATQPPYQDRLISVKEDYIHEQDIDDAPR